VLNNLRSQGFFSAGRSRTAPTVLELGGMCNHFTNILINDIEIGSFSVFELLSPIPAEKIEYLPQIACVLSLEMQKSSFYQTNKATHYTHLFSLLLSGERLNTQDIEARLQLFNYRLRSEKYVVYIDAENLICAGAQLQFLADRIHRTFTNSIYTVKANAIIFLITRDPIDDISNEELSDWNSFMRANSMYAGMSSRFTDLSSVTFRLEEAKRALLIGRMFASSHCFYCFDQYRLGNMIHDLNQQAKLSFYLYPPLMRLIRHEKGKDTQLVYTLYEYLKQTKNPTAVCEKLFIHKNTLFYRLDKIRSIMGIRFESADEITQIQISFTILQYQKALPWPQTETD
jgi:sugar diacid utilization regulator